MRFLLPIFAVVLAGCQAGAQELKTPGSYAEKTTVDGVERDYRLTIPPQHDGTKKLPLVIGLHGWTGNSQLFELQTGFAELAKKEGFIYVSGNGLGKPQGWNVGWIDLCGKKQDDGKYVEMVLDQVEKSARVDPDRVYVCGHSNGGFMTYAAASRLSNRLAAVGVVAGAIGISPKGGVRKTIDDPKGPFPSAILIHGDSDPVVAFLSGAKATLSGVVSQPEAAAWYAQRAGIAAEPTETTDKVAVTKTWSGNGREVRFVAVKNGNHDWFGGLTQQGPEKASGFNCTVALWEFFKAHPRPRS